MQKILKFMNSLLFYFSPFEQFVVTPIIPANLFILGQQLNIMSLPAIDFTISNVTVIFLVIFSTAALVIKLVKSPFNGTFYVMSSYVLLLNLAGNFPIFMSLINQFTVISFFSLPSISIFSTLTLNFCLKIFFLEVLLVLHNEGAVAIAPKPQSLADKIAGAARGLIKWVGDKISGLFAPAKEAVCYFIEILQRVILDLIPTLFLGGIVTFVKVFVISYIMFELYWAVCFWSFTILYGAICLCHSKNLPQFQFAFANIFQRYARICKCLVGPHVFNLAIRRAYLLFNSSYLAAVPYVFYLVNLWGW